MKKAVAAYHRKVSMFGRARVSVRALAKDHNIPHRTLAKRCNGEVKGFKHASGGGYRRPKIFNIGKY